MRTVRDGVGMVVVWAALLATGAGAASAQEMSVSLKGGLSSTSVTWSTSPVGDGLGSVRRGRHLSGGLAVTAALTDRLALHAELIRVGKGFSEGGDDERATIDVAYLELPVLLGVALADRASRVVPELYAGPWAARETSCDASLEAGDLEASFPCNDVPGDPVLRNTTDWGWTAGAMLHLRAAGPLSLVLDLRYSAGLGNVDGSPEIENNDVHHRGLLALVGVSLPLGS